MKKILFFLIAIGMSQTFNSCSEIPENNDPIIGIWSKAVISDTGNQLSKREWTFNDAYLGRYHSYTYDNIVFITDFQWEVNDGVYTISYPGTDMPKDIVTMETIETQGGNTNKTASRSDEVLQSKEGKTLAIRE